MLLPYCSEELGEFLGDTSQIQGSNKADERRLGRAASKCAEGTVAKATRALGSAEEKPGAWLSLKQRIMPIRARPDSASPALLEKHKRLG